MLLFSLLKTRFRNKTTKQKQNICTIQRRQKCSPITTDARRSATPKARYLLSCFLGVEGRADSEGHLAPSLYPFSHRSTYVLTDRSRKWDVPFQLEVVPGAVCLCAECAPAASQSITILHPYQTARPPAPMALQLMTNGGGSINKQPNTGRGNGGMVRGESEKVREREGERIRKN